MKDTRCRREKGASDLELSPRTTRSVSSITHYWLVKNKSKGDDNRNYKSQLHDDM